MGRPVVVELASAAALVVGAADDPGVTDASLIGRTLMLAAVARFRPRLLPTG